MSLSLTPRQRELLDYLCQYQDQHGIAPTFRDMAAHLKCSVSGVYNLLAILERKGFIIRAKGINRGINILFRSDDACDWRGVALTLAEENAELRKKLETAGVNIPPKRVKI
jgi:SOS-response transcriptional repressor LexA